jgi:stage II sporulation protein E
MIRTLKNLIRAGLSVNAALNTYKSITRLYQPLGFSTIDICSIDLNTATADLYKAGAFDSYLLSKGKCFSFEGGGIPIGLIENEKIRHETINLHDGDFLILASDGLSNCEETLEKTLFDCMNDDVGQFARNILQSQSKHSPTYGDDDITVMVCKIKENK